MLQRSAILQAVSRSLQRLYHSPPTRPYMGPGAKAVIKAATEVLYTQATQLFPGPDDTVTHQVKMAVDQEAEIIYWLAPQSASGYISLMCPYNLLLLHFFFAYGTQRLSPRPSIKFLSQQNIYIYIHTHTFYIILSHIQQVVNLLEFDHDRYLDVEGWDSSKPKFEPCDVGEVAGHYAYGSWQGYPVAIREK